MARESFSIVASVVPKLSLQEFLCLRQVEQQLITLWPYIIDFSTPERVVYKEWIIIMQNCEEARTKKSSKLLSNSELKHENLEN